MWIDIPEDGGNIVIINAENSQNIRLEIRPDNNNPDYFQWFNFIVNGEPGETFVLKIENAGSVSFPKWNDEVPYRATACSDGET